MLRISRAWAKRALASGLKTPHLLQSSTTIRAMHCNKILSENTTKQTNSSKPQEDQFSEMMDDRTNALLQSLKINAELLKADLEAADIEAAGKRNKAMDSLTGAVDDAYSSRAAPDNKPRTSFFDTQDVYSELRSSGLTPGQAEIIMRTMQELIHELIATCKDNSVPISAAANEAYLFDAASSEVRNEISNYRQSETTTYRFGLARLQRDVEILVHEAAEMTNLLKSDLDIEVHERKNATRAEENIIQLKIQELNNKISTRLNSDLKSEIENLRWQITRRSLAAIAVIVAMFIWLTQTNNRTKSAKTQERKRQSSGTSIPVPVLAPSMASNDEQFEYPLERVMVEDLSSYSVPSSDSTDDHGSDAHLQSSESVIAGENSNGLNKNEQRGGNGKEIE